MTLQVGKETLIKYLKKECGYVLMSLLELICCDRIAKPADAANALICKCFRFVFYIWYGHAEYALASSSSFYRDLFFSSFYCDPFFEHI